MAYIRNMRYDQSMAPDKGIYYKGMRIGTSVLSSPEFKKHKKKTRVRDFYNTSFPSSFQKDSPKNLIVMYDIPHEKKKERDWFRRHLKKFHYIMIQKSVWVGPSPLPKDFIEYVKSISLQNKLKTFKLTKSFKGEGNIL